MPNDTDTKDPKTKPEPKAKPLELEIHQIDILDRNRLPAIGNRHTLVAQDGLKMHLVSHHGQVCVRVDQGPEHPIAFVPFGSIGAFVTGEDQAAVEGRRRRREQEVAENAAKQRAEARATALAREKAARGGDAEPKEG
jgi:hypothetical protein